MTPPAQAPTTASTTGARAHARAQGSAAPATPGLPAGIHPADTTWTVRLPPGGYTGAVLGRGTRLRLTDPHGSACAHLFLLRAEAPWERLNIADTVKVPWQAYLGAGHPLLSDQGRVLATVVTDTSGHHDTLCGTSRAGRLLLERAAAKYGLEPRDIGPTLSLLRGVRVGSEGDLAANGSAGPGAHIELLIHLPVTVLVADTPHPLDDTPVTELDLVAWPGDLLDTTTVNNDPEYLRAVQNTEQAWSAARTRQEWV
ncbi:DUF1989 domain-containing protein [Nocardia flavorosea]|uniref:DUF1989 domain-containing protein n=1 Tax=Nocardia flavorosea TaxID=53429 RepID=A0A846YI44_9NOCA|nr:DUF1989 domain-containing protein [Nocardia flavorosea]NKY57272.1 DUF1989 domain-containing protein [Nocardia flavorosea]